MHIAREFPEFDAGTPVAKAIRDLSVETGATLTTLPGTIMHTRDEHVAAGGQLNFKSSGSDSNSLGFNEPACTSPFGCVTAPSRGWSLNPSPKRGKMIIVLHDVTTQMGLGGTTPASLTRSRAGWQLAAGPGHYANVHAEDVSLDGPLVVSLHFGFRPAPGDSFEIVRSSRRLSGQFSNLPEGAAVGCTEDNVGLFISYQDGAVRLSAEATPPATCILLPAVQQVREAARR